MAMEMVKKETVSLMNDDEPNDELNGDLLPPYWNIIDADEIVLDGHFSYEMIKAIITKWERYREEERGDE